MKCPKCGKEIADGSQFCEYCGFEIEVGSIVKKGTKVRTILLCSSLLILFAAALALWGYHEKSEAVREVHQDMLKKKGYVDLGLPSGTWWRNENESGEFYSYDDAILCFGNNLPSLDQLKELKERCIWDWKGNGYDVVGPNGNSVFFPADGWDFCRCHIMYFGKFGIYWSSTSCDSVNAWHLVFGPEGIDINKDTRCRGLSVRLVGN